MNRLTFVKPKFGMGITELSSDALKQQIVYCKDCEYFGFYQVPMFTDWYKDDKGEYTRHFTHFDKTQGASCLYTKDIWHARMRIYDNSQACGQFMAKTWVRTDKCCNCNFKHAVYGDKHICCSGYPFTNKQGYIPCENGRTTIDKQLTLI